MRTIAEPFVAAAPGGAMHTTFRASPEEEAVLVEVGTYLGKTQRQDLQARLALGPGEKHLNRAERKRQLTAVVGSRWAAAITRITADMWSTGMENLERLIERDKQEISELECRMWATAETKHTSSKTIPAKTAFVQTKNGRKKKHPKKKKIFKPYRTKYEKSQKNLRLQKLRSRLIDSERRYAAGNPSITVGGKKLAKRRHNLDAEPAITHKEWLTLWRMARLFLVADGEPNVIGGNQGIRVLPDDRAGAEPDTYKIVMRLPIGLEHLSNTAAREPTFVFSAAIIWKNKRLLPRWSRRMQLRLSVGYQIKYVDGRWRILAFVGPEPPPEKTMSLDCLRGGNVLSVDFNAKHFACTVLDPAGNAVGKPHRIGFVLDGSSARRRGQLAAALIKMLDICEAAQCKAIVIENLGFEDVKNLGRQRGGRGKKGKQYRRMVHGFPTLIFKNLLTSMVANSSVVDAVIVIDPAYTSKWGRLHWLKFFNNSRRWGYSSHDVASYVIGRRGLGYGAKRRDRKAKADQCIRSKQNDFRGATIAGTPSCASKEESKDTVVLSKASTEICERDGQASARTVRDADSCGRQSPTQP